MIILPNAASEKWAPKNDLTSGSNAEKVAKMRVEREIDGCYCSG